MKKALEIKENILSIPFGPDGFAWTKEYGISDNDTHVWVIANILHSWYYNKSMQTWLYVDRYGYSFDDPFDGDISGSLFKGEPADRDIIAAYMLLNGKSFHAIMRFIRKTSKSKKEATAKIKLAEKLSNQHFRCFYFEEVTLVAA